MVKGRNCPKGVTLAFLSGQRCTFRLQTTNQSQAFLLISCNWSKNSGWRFSNQRFICNSSSVFFHLAVWSNRSQQPTPNSWSIAKPVNSAEFRTSKDLIRVQKHLHYYTFPPPRLTPAKSVPHFSERGGRWDFALRAFSMPSNVGGPWGKFSRSASATMMLSASSAITKHISGVNNDWPHERTFEIKINPNIMRMSALIKSSGVWGIIW